jgi:hypothetical protein
MLLFYRQIWSRCAQGMLGQTSLTPRGRYVKQIWREKEILDFLLLLLRTVFFRFILVIQGCTTFLFIVNVCLLNLAAVKYTTRNS